MSQFDDADVPEMIGPYEIIGAIASGSFGTVFEGHHPDTGRQAAIKVLKARSDLGADTVLYADHRSAFRAEVTSLVRLKHPHIAPLYEADLQADRPYFAHELVDGETLATRLQARRVSPALLLTVAHAVASALEHAHAKGIVHCDVKPSNIMLDAVDHTYLIDFGVAASLDPTGGVARSTGGTPRYMAPEQLQGDVIDHRADIYALGRVIEDMKDAVESECGTRWLHKLGDLVTGMTQPDRDRRLSSMRDVLLRLDALSRLKPNAAARWPLGLTLLVVCVTLGAGLWLTIQRGWWAKSTGSEQGESQPPVATPERTESVQPEAVEVELGTFDDDGKPLNQPAETVAANIDLSKGPITISGGFLGQYASGLQIGIGDLDADYLMTQLYPHRDRRHGFEQWWKAADKAVYYGHELPGYEYDLGAYHTLTVTYDGQTIRSTLTSQQNPDNTVTIERQRTLPAQLVDVTFRIFADHMDLQPFRVTQTRVSGDASAEVVQ